MSDIIKFEFDRPVEVALRFTEPRVFPSQFDGGDDRHMFSTTDGRVMYVSPLTSARIKALRLAQGECFFICKRKNGRLTEFEVSRETSESIEPAAPKPLRPPAPFKTNLPERAYYKPELSPAAEAMLEEQLRASIEMVNRRKAGEHRIGGRPSLVVDRDRLTQLDEEGWTTREIGEEMGISAASVSRLLKAHHRPQNPAAGL